MSMLDMFDDGAFVDGVLCSPVVFAVGVNAAADAGVFVGMFLSLCRALQ